MRPSWLRDQRRPISMLCSYQETQLLGRATAAGYSNVAIEILRRLKERPVAEDEKDVGIDGEWKPRPRVVIAEPPMDELEKLTTPIDQLRLMGYPFPPDETTAVTTPAAEQEDEMAEQHEKCDRCSKRFVPDWPLEEADMTVCRHHWGYARSLVSNGVKERQWSCCQQSLESQGCTEGPHVFKEEDTALLEKRIPFTVLPPSSPTSAKIVGIDCEMSYTTGGMDLTRLTIVPYIPNPPSGSNSANPTPLIDELVRTTYPVLDYNTRWSGISSLDSARYDIDGIKDLMATVVGRDTIIVGHGLENDLKAMRLYHTRIIDTAFLFPHPRGLPQRHSLRLLTQKVLGRFIQQGGSAGHDSAQDAVAALDLVRSRVMKGENARIH
ncbi:ribonuclease H-like domain-containing protein [Powellomyces hirtus]|nr:ribonuclease H-like domain-containing protein [Powellomyces hirtus]